MTDAKEIGARLRKLRGDLSMQEVADKLGTAVSTIGMYERGERVPIDEIKVKLADFYGVTVQEIFFN